MTYPNVIGEFDTLRMVLGGASLARYGDGEFNLALGGRAKCQSAHPVLMERLRRILKGSTCEVGIPNIQSHTPKIGFWRKYLLSPLPLLTEGRDYASAFITRPDSAPWIDTPNYWASLVSLWHGRAVTLVCGSDRSLRAADLVGAGTVTEVVGPRENAWDGYDALLERIGRPAMALLCLGPTATVLAEDLCARGVQAVDLGHIGCFLRKHRRGEPMAMTAEDHAA